MPLAVTRLRRWFAVLAIAMIAIVAGMYLYARWRVRNVVHEVPKKLGIEIQQTAEGFSISKSEQGRTVFTVKASKVVQFKSGGHAELHDVVITVFGKDASRFDHISGKSFQYDPASGDISAKGLVQIDLENNPQGILRPDQAPPAELKDPIHVETEDLVFNKNTGNAAANGRVQLRTTQASGSAVGVRYVAQTGTMTLISAVVLDVNNPQASHLTAEEAVLTKTPRQITLTKPILTREDQKSRSDTATVFLRGDNSVDRVLAEGNVENEVSRPSAIAGKQGESTIPVAKNESDRAELFLAGPRNLLERADFSGHVHMASLSDRPAEAYAGHAVVHFVGKQVLQLIHADQGVRLLQKAGGGAAMGSRAGPRGQNGAQDLEMTAPAMDLHIAEGKRLDRAETVAVAGRGTSSESPQILITQQGSDQKTVVTAPKFNARFTDNRISSLHGEPESKIVNSAPGQPDRVSTSRALDVTFQPQGGVESLVQSGDFVYVDGSRKAWAERATYTTADQMLVLNGAPRVAGEGMMTTAQVVRMNRATGDAFADGNVKTTYFQTKANPQGGMLGSSDPIHVTSRGMVAHRTPDVADYTGNARLWQNANVVEAPSIHFDRGRRSLLAQGNDTRQVSTVLVQQDKNGKVNPVTVVSPRLTYTDDDRKVVCDGGSVTVKQTDSTMTAQLMNVFLRPRSQSAATNDVGVPGQVDHIDAQGNIVIVQPTRRATGDHLHYTADDDKFVLTGGPPSIFDAERGKITGDSLTFFRRDDRVLVEGRETSPTVTKTRVAR